MRSVAAFSATLLLLVEPAAVSEEWVEAFRAGDLDRLLSLYADDARIM